MVDQRIAHRAGPVVELDRAADVDAARVDLDRDALDPALEQRPQPRQAARLRAAPGRTPLPRTWRGTRGSPRSAALRASRSGRRRPTCSCASPRPARRSTSPPAPCARPGPARPPGSRRGSAGPFACACGVSRERACRTTLMRRFAARQIKRTIVLFLPSFARRRGACSARMSPFSRHWLLDGRDAAGKPSGFFDRLRMQRMKITVVGLGAVAGLIAARLALAGHEVSASRAAPPAGGARARACGCESAAQSSVAPHHRRDDARALGPQELVVIALKGQALPELAPALRAADRRRHLRAAGDERRAVVVPADAGTAPAAPPINCDWPASTPTARSPRPCRWRRCSAAWCTSPARSPSPAWCGTASATA